MDYYPNSQIAFLNLKLADELWVKYGLNNTLWKCRSSLPSTVALHPVVANRRLNENSQCSSLLRVFTGLRVADDSPAFSSSGELPSIQ